MMLWTLHILLFDTALPRRRIWEHGKADYAINFLNSGVNVTRSFLVPSPFLRDIILPFKGKKQTKGAFEPFHQLAVLALFPKPV